MAVPQAGRWADTTAAVQPGRYIKELEQNLTKSSLLRAGALRADRDGVLAVGLEVVLHGLAIGAEVPAGDEVDVVAGEVLDEDGAVRGDHHLEDGGHLEGRVQHALARLQSSFGVNDHK